MNKQQLLYFLAVADEKNISKAASRLRIPQPHLSNQIKAIEDELGVKLAERKTRKFQLTDAGIHFQYRAKQIVSLMDTTDKEVLEFEGGYLGALKIGATATPCAIFLPEKISLFHRMYPMVDIELQTLSATQIIEYLELGVIEIGLLRNAVDRNIYETVDFPPNPMVAAASAAYFTGCDQQNLDITFLNHKPLIINNKTESVITKACQEAGFSPDYRCRMDDTRTALLCAHHGTGVAIVPKDFLIIAPDLNLSYLELAIPSLDANTALIWLRQHEISLVAKNFIKLFCDDGHT